MMAERCEVAIIGSGFAGSLLARILSTIGYDVVLLERGAHPRFAIGESSTPLANLCLERLGARYGMPDCWRLATHGRWLDHHPELGRGLKRGFTFLRHHRDVPFANRGLESERLLVAASPCDAVADTHWLRADVDHHFVRQAVVAGVDYRDRVALTHAFIDEGGVCLSGRSNGTPVNLHAGFVIDASGPGGFLARALALPSALERMQTHSASVFSHFAGVRRISDVVPGLPDGPYPDDRAAVHHLLDEGWMYSLRFDDGVTSAGFVLSPRGIASVAADDRATPGLLWRTMLGRYPSIAAAFAGAEPLRPLEFRERLQYRLTSASGDRWAMLPHTYAFVDPLFSTGIAWSLRGVERLALAFEAAARGRRRPGEAELSRYSELLGAEADQIDTLVVGAYAAMAHFDLFAAHAMIYFATVSFAEVLGRLGGGSSESHAWSGFLGVGDPVSESLPRESLGRLRQITGGDGNAGSTDQRRRYAAWVAGAIAPRNVAGLMDHARHNLYPVDLEVLTDRHALLGMSRGQLVAALPSLRGMTPEPVITRV